MDYDEEVVYHVCIERQHEGFGKVDMIHYVYNSVMGGVKHSHHEYISHHMGK